MARAVVERPNVASFAGRPVGRKEDIAFWQVFKVERVDG
jgi:hypothetical protein